MADGLGIFTFKNKRHMPAWLAWLIVGLMRFYVFILRKRYTDPHGVLKRTRKDKPQIYVTWHNRGLLATALMPRTFAERISIIVSASRDGGYMAAVLERLGVHCVRGSSSRGGFNALMEAIAGKMTNAEIRSDPTRFIARTMITAIMTAMMKL